MLPMCCGGGGWVGLGLKHKGEGSGWRRHPHYVIYFAMEAVLCFAMKCVGDPL